MDAVIKAVCSWFQLERNKQLLSHKRHRQLSYPRMVAMYVARHYVQPQPSFPKLAKALRRGDHSTVIHGVATIGRRLLTEPGIQRDVDGVRALAEMLSGTRTKEIARA